MMHQREVIVVEQSFLARWAALWLKKEQVAMVWGHKILLHNTNKATFLANQKWLCHELQHLVQVQEKGWLRFLCLYLYHSLKHGYHNNPFEVEARAHECDDKLLDRFNLRHSGTLDHP